MFKKIFESLEGEWSIEREITGFGNFLGKGNFVKLENSCYEYKEHGKMLRTIDGYRTEANQSYIYKYSNDLDVISVYFHETPYRLFHTITLAETTEGEIVNGSGYHRCINDDYFAEYSFRNNEFEISFKIKGPKKDYQIHSIFRKSSHLRRHEINDKSALLV